MWDVSSVEVMDWMFEDAIRFNADLSSWDVSTVRSMLGMFQRASSFYNNLCMWGAVLSSSVRLDGIFTDTSCPREMDPILYADIPGPLCFACSW